MTKELIITIIIVVLILAGNYITLKYTETSINEAISKLTELKQEIVKEDANFEYANNKMENLSNDWDKRHIKLSYYIEHDELEKIETSFAGLKGYIEEEEYSEAVSELERSIYILGHIQHKNLFSLENIF